MRNIAVCSVGNIFRKFNLHGIAASDRAQALCQFRDTLGGSPCVLFVTYAA
jgi:hypothetical protein